VSETAVSEFRFESVPAVRQGLKEVAYLADEGIAGVVYLADRLQKPVLIEGPAGTGKTQLAKSVAEMTGARLIRLQCYEGLDESKALYEWNYKKQLLRIQAQRVAEEGAATSWADIEEDIFSEDFLLTRPLLEAIRAEENVVLLIDEVDRVEVETEALLLEILSDYQVSIPELGTVGATQIPLVFLTSNNTRELSEALKRRCLYLHIDYPELDREKEIVLTRVPDIGEHLAPDRAHRAVHPPARAQEAPVGVGDARLGPHARAPRRQGRRRRAGQGHPPHPAQVPVRHRPGHQGAVDHVTAVPFFEGLGVRQTRNASKNAV
jgi:MoxR-like ATPase